METFKRISSDKLLDFYDSAIEKGLDFVMTLGLDVQYLDGLCWGFEWTQKKYPSAFNYSDIKWRLGFIDGQETQRLVFLGNGE